MRVFVLAFVTTTLACGSTQTASTASTPETERIDVPGAASGASGGLRLHSSSVARLDTLWVSLDRVWKVLPAVYGVLEIPIERYDAESNEIGHSALKLYRRLGKTQLTKLIDCGTTQIGPNADSYEVLLTVITKLTRSRLDTSVTTVSTIVSGRARPVQFNGAHVTCRSKGQLEARIAEVLKVNLQ